MSTAKATHAEVYSVLKSALLTGFISPFAYHLGTHVIHALARQKSRKLTASVRQFFGLAVTGEEGGIIASPLEKLMYLGSGRILSDNDVSLNYILALQELHRLGVLYSTIADADADADTAYGRALRGTHFTTRPRLAAGRDWNEHTHVSFTLPDCTHSKLVAQVASLLGIPEWAKSGIVGEVKGF